MIKVAIVHVGYKNYLEENIKITSKTNKVILIGDESVRKLGEFYNVEFILIDKYIKNNTNKYKKYFTNYSSNNSDFEFICFLRVFILHDIMKEYNIEKIFHIDSDNILLKDINDYPFDKDASYVVNYSDDKPYHMAHSIHCSLITHKFCEVFKQLYLDIYDNKTKLNLIKGKINYHKNNNIPGGICDMTLYYLIEKYNMLSVQNLSEPVIINNKKYVFINNYNTAEGYLSMNQYKLDNKRIDIIKDTNNIDNTIYDEINNETYVIFNIHFQGIAKAVLNYNILNKVINC